MTHSFLAIVPPNAATGSDEIIELARKAAAENAQALPCAGSDRTSAVASISATCLSTAVTKRSKCALSGLIHFPYAWVAFCRLMGMPAIDRVITALFAIVAAATVSTYQAISSSVTATTLRAKALFCRESRNGGKQ
ncbi:hypothetical protein QE408_003102 [Agrobacterium larrymoorei]|uniref:Uncharacterized protein n=1 Tax=Agrobacterium larrymoorei TaxID=160699 RepID=A0ABU0ULY4_9HYPH|nr:hypothetical protein [Agrobacterium larrymoorei]